MAHRVLLLLNPSSQMSLKRKADEQLTNPFKLCGGCKISQPLTNFNRKSKDGNKLESHCKGCKRIQQATRKGKREAMLKENPNVFGTHHHCRNCKQDLPRGEFYDHPNGKKNKASTCITCTNARAYQGSWKCKQNWLKWLDGKSCENCGENNPKYLQACHIDRSTKTRDVSSFRSVKRQNEELKKCKCLCVICHQQETSEENGTTTNKHRLERRQLVNNEKARRGCCLRCSRKFDPSCPSIFHFDHRNPETKIDGICEMVSDCRPKELIKAEMEKCDLLCSKCHIDVTAERRDDEWRMFVDYCNFGDDCIPKLAERFNRGIDKVEEIVQLKMSAQVILERAFQSSWIDHVVWE